VQKFHDQKVLKSYRGCFFSLWNYVRNQHQKIFENNPHIFKISTLIDENLGTRRGEAAYP